MIFRLVTSVVIPRSDTEFFLCAHKTKNILLYFFTKLKTHLLSYSITKYDAIDIADPSSMQDVCYMNFVIDLAHCRVSVAQW